MASSNNTKLAIATAARDLFASQGYAATTMQQISERTGKSLGNINYYFPRKEDILMFLHRQGLEHFFQEVKNECEETANPLKKYLSVHCGYLLMVLRNPDVRNMYVDATKQVSCRIDYISIFHELYLHYLNADDARLDKRDIFIKNTLLCGGEFEMVCLYTERPNEYNMEDVLIYPMRAFLQFFSLSDEEQQEIISFSINHGKKLADRFVQNFDL